MQHIAGRSTLEGLVEDVPVHTADAYNERRAAVDRTGAHQGCGPAVDGDIRCLPPSVVQGVIAQASAVGAVGAIAAQQVEHLTLGTALHGSHRLQARLAGKVGQPLPLAAAGPLKAEGPVGSHAVSLAAGHIDIAATVGSRHVVEAHGQWRQTADSSLAPTIAEQQGGGKALPAVGTANNGHAVRHAHAHAVGHAVGQLADLTPSTLRHRRLESIDVAVEHLPATLSGRHVGEVATACHQDKSVAHSGKRRTHALFAAHPQLRQRSKPGAVESPVSSSLHAEARQCKNSNQKKADN